MDPTHKVQKVSIFTAFSSAIRIHVVVRRVMGNVTSRKISGFRSGVDETFGYVLFL
jgi:hypothetical protein